MDGGDIMPIYKYVCTVCEREVEVLQKMSDEPLKYCPHCGGKLLKTIGSVGVVFKGSGFYVTDSRKSNNSETVSSKSNGKSEKSDE